MGRSGSAIVIAMALAGLMVFPGTDIAIALLCLPFILALSAGSCSPVARLLAARPVHWLGVISYSIYLMHQPVVDAFRTPLLRRVAFHHAYTIVTFGLAMMTIALASICYYVVERPLRRWSRRVWTISAMPHSPSVAGEAVVAAAT